MKVALVKILVLFSVCTIFSCSNSNGKVDRESQVFDKKANLSKSEYKKYLYQNNKSTKQIKKDSKSKFAKIPTLSTFSSRPPKPVSDEDFLDNYYKISFSVTDDVPLKDVLIELGRIAKIDTELDPNISGGIILAVHDRPLGQVIKRICRLGNLRYKYQDGVMRFERDLPYNNNYSVDYLDEGSNMWSEVEATVSQLLKNGKASASTLRSRSGNDDIPNSSISLNKSAGILSIYATKIQHDTVKQYLYDVKRKASAQVLIEAKVVEVSLNDEFRTGIDWDFTGSQSLLSDGGFSAVIVGGSFGDINLSIDALSKFGTTRTLSSPRVHAINNRKSTLEFINKLVYFKVESDTSVAGNDAVGVTTQTVTSSKEEASVGVELSITPSIDLDSNEITLQITPKITVLSAEVVDPASPRDDNNVIIIENKVPVIQTRKIDTVAKIMSGNTIVIGGLMEEVTSVEVSGVPILKDIPGLGWLFKIKKDVSRITETVIFIKATIVDSTASAGKIDRQIQEKFDTNRRKLF